MRILVVDDELVSRKALTSILEARGYEIVTAATVSEAIRLCLEDSTFRLIVMDVMLTDGDGVSAAKAVRKSCNAGVLYTSGTPVSGLLAQGILQPEEAEAAGFHFLAKPFKAAEVWAAVERALSGDEGGEGMIS
jgi:two-component system KDP operon response regulator KdpE